MQGVASRQIRKVRQSARHLLVLRDTFDSCRELERDRQVGRPGQPHSALANKLWLCVDLLLPRWSVHAGLLILFAITADHNNRAR